NDLRTIKRRCSYILPQYLQQHIVSELFQYLCYPPPGSRLFPYTTLFRSGLILRVRPLVRCDDGNGSLEELRVLMRHLVRGRSSQDRKSTRLNFSHVKISYAVFCLIKKNHTLSALHISNYTS